MLFLEALSNKNNELSFTSNRSLLSIIDSNYESTDERG